MRHFCAEPDSLNKNKYIVTVAITIYMQMLGKYPDFLSDFNTPESKHDGYTTRFIYICNKSDETEAVDMNEDEAIALANEYEEKLAPIIKNCESTGDWSTSPFDFNKLELIFSK